MRCRAGELAFVVDDIANPKNNGAIVKVLRRANPDFYDDPVDWDCTAEGTLLDEEGQLVPGGQVVGFLDRELRPIQPLGDGEQQEELLDIPFTATRMATVTAGPRGSLGEEVPR